MLQDGETNSYSLTGFPLLQPGSADIWMRNDVWLFLYMHTLTDIFIIITIIIITIITIIIITIIITIIIIYYFYYYYIYI